MSTTIFRSWVLFISIAASGCATIHESVPPKLTSSATISVAPSSEMPKADFLPEQSAVAPGTKYVMIQAGGGSVLLGPILGSLNIAANTKEMAEKYKNSVLSIDPTAVALDSLAQVGLNSRSSNSSFIVRPFVFVQHCYDDKFRLAIVFHVEGTTAGDQWVGRYTYHLPTSYHASRFGNLTAEEIANYRTELEKGSISAAKLLQRDLTGALSATGKKIKFGTLHIMGNKVGGMGIYTMPEELHFPNAELVEETDDYVTVRLKGNMRMTGAFGGMAFGVHRIDKKLVHTLKPAQRA